MLMDGSSNVQPLPSRTVLVVERAKEKIPVYYIHHALAGAEFNYPLIEKFAYTLVLASQNLHPYFEAYGVAILTN